MLEFIGESPINERESNTNWTWTAAWKSWDLEIFKNSYQGFWRRLNVSYLSTRSKLISDIPDFRRFHEFCFETSFWALPPAKRLKTGSFLRSHDIHRKLGEFLGNIQIYLIIFFLKIGSPTFLSIPTIKVCNCQLSTFRPDLPTKRESKHYLSGRVPLMFINDAK